MDADERWSDTLLAMLSRRERYLDTVGYGRLAREAADWLRENRDRFDVVDESVLIHGNYFEKHVAVGRDGDGVHVAVGRGGDGVHVAVGRGGDGVHVAVGRGGDGVHVAVDKCGDGVHVAVDKCGDGVHAGTESGEVTAVIDFEHALAAPPEWDYLRTVLPVFGPTASHGVPERVFREAYESVRPLPTGFDERREAYIALNGVSYLRSFHLQRGDLDDTEAVARRGHSLANSLAGRLETLQADPS